MSAFIWTHVTAARREEREAVFGEAFYEAVDRAGLADKASNTYDTANDRAALLMQIRRPSPEQVLWEGAR